MPHACCSSSTANRAAAALGVVVAVLLVVVLGTACSDPLPPPTQKPYQYRCPHPSTAFNILRPHTPPCPHNPNTTNQAAALVCNGNRIATRINPPRTQAKTRPTADQRGAPQAYNRCTHCTDACMHAYMTAHCLQAPHMARSNMVTTLVAADSSATRAPTSWS